VRFFIYARKSTEDEARQVLSIDAQLDELRMLASKERLDVAHEYLEAQTAKEPGRSVFNSFRRTWRPRQEAVRRRAVRRSRSTGRSARRPTCCAVVG